MRYKKEVYEMTKLWLEIFSAKNYTNYEYKEKYGKYLTGIAYDKNGVSLTIDDYQYNKDYSSLMFLLENDIVLWYKIADVLSIIPYREFLQTLYWRVIRDYKINESNKCCDACHSTLDRSNQTHFQLYNSYLEVHHKTYDHRGSEHKHLDDLVVLCSNCHTKLHSDHKYKEFVEKYGDILTIRSDRDLELAVRKYNLNWCTWQKDYKSFYINIITKEVFVFRLVYNFDINCEELHLENIYENKDNNFVEDRIIEPYSFEIHNDGDDLLLSEIDHEDVNSVDE